jgi:hypothetical protein
MVMHVQMRLPIHSRLILNSCNPIHSFNPVKTEHLNLACGYV